MKVTSRFRLPWTVELKPPNTMTVDQALAMADKILLYLKSNIDERDWMAGATGLYPPFSRDKNQNADKLYRHLLWEPKKRFFRVHVRSEEQVVLLKLMFEDHTE